MIRVGSVLYGFCEGRFGRDSYGEKRVEAIGADWLVARENGRPVVMITASSTEMDAVLADPNFGKEGT